MRRGLRSLVEWFPFWALPLLLAASAVLGGVHVDAAGLVVSLPVDGDWSISHTWLAPSSPVPTDPDGELFVDLQCGDSSQQITFHRAVAVTARADGEEQSVAWGGPGDFDLDGARGTDRDLSAFFVCLTTPGCESADFDGDGDAGTDQDIAAFFRWLGGQ